MKKTVFEKRKKIPPYLAPTIKKRHAVQIFAKLDRTWRLFSEGCLRNRFFYDHVFARRPKCQACRRTFNRGDAKVHSRIEKHHNSFARLCIGQVLEDGSEDIYREPAEGESAGVPDCRQCAINNPEYFQGCRKLIYPVQAACHEDIHAFEHWLIRKRKTALLQAFNDASRDSRLSIKNNGIPTVINGQSNSDNY